MLTPTKPVKSCECGSPCGDCCGCTKESIGLGNVDNTSDLNKPLSTAMINALSGKVDLDTFTQLKNRVLALENSIPDITDLEHRMDEAEDDILGLNAGYNSLHNTVLSMADSITELGGRVTGVSDGLVTVGTRVDALEDEDSNNVKLTGVSEQTIVGKLKANDPASGATDKTLVTANWVSQTGNNAPNNLLHKTGDEKTIGLKEGNFRPYRLNNPDLTNVPAGKWLRYAQWQEAYGPANFVEIIGNRGNNGYHYGKAMVNAGGNYTRVKSFINSPGNSGVKFVAVVNVNESKLELWIYIANREDALATDIYMTSNYQITYLNEPYDNLPTTGYGPFIYLVGSA